MCPSPASARTGRARLLTALPEVRVEPGRPPQRQVMVATRCPVPLSQSPALGLSWQIPKGRCWTWNLQANGLAGLSVLLEYGVVVKGGALARVQDRERPSAQRLEPAADAPVCVSGLTRVSRGSDTLRPSSGLQRPKTGLARKSDSAFLQEARVSAVNVPACSETLRGARAPSPPCALRLAAAVRGRLLLVLGKPALPSRRGLALVEGFGLGYGGW